MFAESKYHWSKHVALDKCFLQYLPSCSDFSTSSWKSDLWFDLKRQVLKPQAAANSVSQQIKRIWHTLKLQILRQRDSPCALRTRAKSLKIQTFHLVFGRKKNSHKLNKGKSETQLSIAKVSCWVICIGRGDFLKNQDLPCFSHPTTSGKTHIISSRVELELNASWIPPKCL